jgi:hypothetical protein
MNNEEVATSIGLRPGYSVVQLYTTRGYMPVSMYNCTNLEVILEHHRRNHPP